MRNFILNKFDTKFTSQQLLFEAFFDIMGIFGSVDP